MTRIQKGGIGGPFSREVRAALCEILSVMTIRKLSRPPWRSFLDPRMTDHRNFSVKLLIISFPSIVTYVLTKTYVLGAQKNRLIETVLLSTHNICFG